MAGERIALNVTEGRRRSKPVACEREHLEQDSHLARIDQPCRPGGDQLSLLGACRLKKAVAPLRKAEPQQELALRHGAISAKAERFSVMFQGGEVDMSGDVGLARQG